MFTSGILDEEHYRQHFESIKLMESDPVLRNDHRFYDMTREEMWINGFKKMRRTFELDRVKWFENIECNQYL